MTNLMSGVRIPKLYVDIVFGHENIFLCLNLAKVHIFIPKCTAGGGGRGLGKFPKKHFFTTSSS